MGDTIGARSVWRTARLWTLPWLLVAASLAALSAPAGADAHAELRIAFDGTAGELPEGVAVDKTGNVFVSIAPLGELWRIPPGSTNPEPFGKVAGVDPVGGDLGMLGLAVDPQGNVYAGVQAASGDANGVWMFERRTGQSRRIAGSELIGIPNDVAFDKRGNLYITDSAAGVIWRLPKHGGLEPWLSDDPNLAGTGDLGLGVPIGANGIEFRHGTLYVANTEKQLLVTVPVNPDGTPGASQVLADLGTEVGPSALPDGLALDVHGNVYVAAIAMSAVLHVSQEGNVTTIASAADGDPLDWPSSLAFGSGRGERQTLFAVNFSIGEDFGDPRSLEGIVAIAVGVPGLPQP